MVSLTGTWPAHAMTAQAVRTTRVALHAAPLSLGDVRLTTGKPRVVENAVMPMNRT
jgi:hypothetical protein